MVNGEYNSVGCCHCRGVHTNVQLKGSVKEPNMFYNYETEKITRKDSDVRLCILGPHGAIEMRVIIIIIMYST